MKLFYFPSSCSLAPHIVLRELGLPFDLERVDPVTKRTRSGDDFRAINPKAYVPALRLDDGEVLTEGPAITQYLADKHAPGVLAPLSGTVERARVNGHLTFVGTELHKPWGPLFDPATTPDVRAEVAAKLGRGLGLVERTLSDGRPHLAGPDYTLADAYLFVVQRWAPMTGVDLAPFPHLLAFAGRIAARPAVRDALDAEAAAEAS